MAMKSRALARTIMFDVVYEDGSRSSNRKVPATLLDGLDGDEPARAMIEAQDREIGLASGRPRSDIKSISRTPIKEAFDDTADRKAKSGRR